MDGFPREGGTGDIAAHVWMEDQTRGDNSRTKREADGSTSGEYFFEEIASHQWGFVSLSSYSNAHGTVRQIHDGAIR